MQANNHPQPLWKEKAIERGKDKKKLNKRIKELSISRDNWKEKYTLQKQETDRFRHQIVKIKKKMNEIIQE